MPFVQKSRLSPPGNRVSRMARTHLHFHGARLANAYCIYLLASKVNLPAPVYEPCAHTAHTHTHKHNLAAITGTERRVLSCVCGRIATIASLMRLPRACVGGSARRLKGIHFSNTHDEPRETDDVSRPFAPRGFE